MNPNMNRWLVSATWLAAVIAVISASTKGAMGVGAMWAIPAAIAVTMGAMGWPDKPAARVLAALGVVWQLALIGAYFLDKSSRIAKRIAPAAAPRPKPSLGPRRVK